MIMAAGVGSRLMPLTMYVPKPMIPLANRPLMDNILHWLHGQQFTSLICNLHYQPQMISDYFGNGQDWGVSLEYSLENELLGTAGGVKNCEWFLNETFAVVSGDALTDIQLARMMQYHKARGALATIALKAVTDVEQFGIVVTNDNGRIERFQEKPRPEEACSRLANTGIYIFEPEIFKYIPPRQFYDFGKQLFPHLVKIKAPFFGMVVEDYWCDIGSLRTYREAQVDAIAGRVAMSLPGQVVTMPGGARVLLGADVKIGEKVKWQGVNVVGDGCVIADGTSIANSVLWNHTTVGRESRLEEAVLGNNCLLGNRVHIAAGAVINSGCEFPAGVKVPAQSRVFQSAGSTLQLEQG
ncbi:MAG: sugar phosphate nucleotidyltransferase [Syntrophomonadaceae bacterium]|jgi:mannose-1-phosphate guanylyltransferase